MGSMVETATVPRRTPDGIQEAELYELLTADAGELDKQMISFRVTGEGRRILAEYANKFGVDKTKALEFALRELRKKHRL